LINGETLPAFVASKLYHLRRRHHQGLIARRALDGFTRSGFVNHEMLSAFRTGKLNVCPGVRLAGWGSISLQRGNYQALVALRTLVGFAGLGCVHREALTALRAGKLNVHFNVLSSPFTNCIKNRCRYLLPHLNTVNFKTSVLKGGIERVVCSEDTVGTTVAAQQIKMRSRRFENRVLSIRRVRFVFFKAWISFISRFLSPPSLFRVLTG